MCILFSNNGRAQKVPLCRLQEIICFNACNHHNYEAFSCSVFLLVTLHVTLCATRMTVQSRSNRSSFYNSNQCCNQLINFKVSCKIFFFSCNQNAKFLLLFFHLQIKTSGKVKKFPMCKCFSQLYTRLLEARMLCNIELYFRCFFLIS